MTIPSRSYLNQFFRRQDPKAGPPNEYLDGLAAGPPRVAGLVPGPLCVHKQCWYQRDNEDQGNGQKTLPVGHDHGPAMQGGGQETERRIKLHEETQALTKNQVLNGLQQFQCGRLRGLGSRISGAVLGSALGEKNRQQVDPKGATQLAQEIDSTRALT